MDRRQSIWYDICCTNDAILLSRHSQRVVYRITHIYITQNQHSKCANVDDGDAAAAVGSVVGPMVPQLHAFVGIALYGSGEKWHAYSECEKNLLRKWNRGKNTIVFFCRCSQFQRMLTFSSLHFVMLSVCHSSETKIFHHSAIDDRFCVYVFVYVFCLELVSSVDVWFVHSISFIRCHTVDSAALARIPIAFKYALHIRAHFLDYGRHRAVRCVCVCVVSDVCVSKLYFREIIRLNSNRQKIEWQFPQMVNGSNVISFAKLTHLHTQLPVNTRNHITYIIYIKFCRNFHGMHAKDSIHIQWRPRRRKRKTEREMDVRPTTNGN